MKRAHLIERDARTSFYLFMVVFLLTFSVLSFSASEEKEERGYTQTPSVDFESQIVSPTVRNGVFRRLISYIPEYAVTGCEEVKLEEGSIVNGFVSLNGPCLSPLKNGTKIQN